MKTLLKAKKDTSSTTSERKKKLQVKENNHLFNQIDKLAADHDVKVSNTMIKITYKKALKDQNASDNTVDCDPESNFTESKNKPKETTNLCSSDISFIMKSPKIHSESSRSSIFHSTPKPPAIDSERKKNYINGLNLSVKETNSEGKNCATKAQKSSTSQENGSSGLKKTKQITNKSTTKTELDKRFLKNNSLNKTKSIIQSGSDSRTMKLNKISLKKLENKVKKKSAVEEKGKKIVGIKRKSSSREVSVLRKLKKMKLNENKAQETEGCQRFEENSRTAKKPIMYVDPDLPPGWTRFVRTKGKGSPNEQHVVYVVNPQGKKFRFKWKLRKYLQRTNSSLDADQFFFGLYKRPKATNSPGTDKDEKSTDKALSLAELPSPETENLTEKIQELENVTPCESDNGPSISSDGKEILVCDPDLPFGWKRIIHSNNATGRKQVHIISPEGKIFRRRYRLNEYLIKHQYSHSLDRFYFGLYPKKTGNASENLGKGAEEKTRNAVKMHKPKSSLEVGSIAANHNAKTNATATNFHHDKDSNGDSKTDLSNSPMYDDPNLPEGWKRFIKIRSCGESAGRMEVIIVSPDGKKHRSRKHLEHYLIQKQLNYKAKDFDFTVSGRTNPKTHPSPTPELEPQPEPVPEANDMSFLGTKKKFTDKPVPELDISSLKESVISPEGHLINAVNGLMVCSGLSSARHERRQRLPRGQHEKQLKTYLSSEVHSPFDGPDIPTHWVQRLVKCRGDFRTLEPDAATTIAETTKEFIKKLSLHALSSSEQAETGLRYEDLAEIVDRTECLSFLKTLIPQKITFREYVKLNRPKKFMSFT